MVLQTKSAFKHNKNTMCTACIN